MPTTKMTAANFLDLGVVSTPVATSVLDNGVTLTAAQPAGETMTTVMAASKQFTATQIKKDALLGIIVSAKNPLELATALIKARYDLLEGAKGFLGSAQGAVTSCPDGVGFYRHFAGGSIYWSPSTGAHEVHGLIRQKWAALGWERSALGYPRTDEKAGRDTKQEGRYNEFQGGYIFYHPQSGTFEVHGAILGKYLELGGEASILGYPTTDETGTPDGRGRYNHFQRGSIYWTSTTWAHEVHGLIRNYWAQNGWERNAQLGYPLTDELVPHRGVGYTPAPSWNKPIDLPFDVLKLPVEEPPPKLKVVTAPTLVVTATPVKTTAAATKSAALAKSTSSTKVSAKTTKAAALAAPTPAPISLVKLGTTDLVATPVVVFNPSILINDHTGRSDDRYADFENGLLFWKRSTNAVSLISPRAKSPQGAQVAFTAAEITAIAGARLKAALGAIPGATAAAPTFAGLTGYSFDGAGLHNRAHRIRVTLTGKRADGANIANVVEAIAEISLDPIDREIVGYLTSWSLPSYQGDFTGGGSLLRLLHARLDAALWKQFLVIKVPATTDNPIAILSVKSHTDGRVATYFEL